MDEKIIKLKTNISLPKLYSLLVGSVHGESLYLGVHFSLEEAYESARINLENTYIHSKGESVDIELWNMISVQDIINSAIQQDNDSVEEISKLSKPTTTIGVANFSKENPRTETITNNIDDYIKILRDSKNALMKKLIEDGNLDKVEESKSLLDMNSRRYVIKSIKEKNLK